MGLIKHRPSITLLLPRELLPGGTYDARVVITARREVPIEWLELSIDGKERCVIGSGNHSQTHVASVMRLGAKLSGARKLPAGRTEFPFRFDLPGTAPPSYRGTACTIEYTATIRASIAWWPDAKSSFDLCVVSLPAERGVDTPVIFSSDPAGPKAQEPHVEGSLPSATIEPGGVVEGVLALNNVAYNPYSSLEVGLIGTESVVLDGVDKGSTETARYSLVFPVNDPVDGGSIPFSFRIPEGVTPTLSTHLWRLDWSFFVRLKVRWRSDLSFRVALRLVAAPQRGVTPRRSYRAPPSVGSKRVEKLWQVVAEGQGLRYESGRLSGSAGAVDFEVLREHRGRQGVFLAAHYDYPSLHLDLRIEPVESSLRRLVSRVIGDETDWDSRYSLSGRDAHQALAFAEGLRPLLDQIHALSVTDEQAVVDVRGSGQRRERLQAFVSGAVDTARVLDYLRQNIPPPNALDEGLAQWEAVARRLDGTLEKARMVVRGTFHAMPAEIRSEWTSEGLPDWTVLVLRPNVTIPKARRVHLSSPESDGLLVPGSPTATSEPATEALLQMIRQDAESFDFAGEALYLSLPGATLNPLPLLDRLALMAQFWELLCAGKGPFR